MKKSIWIFLLAVLLPSAILGWLALRSAEEQQIILEKRTAELYQTETEDLARTIRLLIEDEHLAFNQSVQNLLAKTTPESLAQRFSADLAKEWSRTAIGFAIGKHGEITTPTPQNAAPHPEWKSFLRNHSDWLTGTQPATVYSVLSDTTNRAENLSRNRQTTPSPSPPLAEQKAEIPNLPLLKASPKSRSLPNPARLTEEKKSAPAKGAAPQEEAAVQVASSAPPLIADTTNRDAQPAPPPEFAVTAAAESQPQSQTPSPMRAAASSDPLPLAKVATKDDPQIRQVEPAKNFSPDRLALSQVVPTTSNFLALTTDASQGVITRFVQDQLKIIFWLRPAQSPELIFGCLIEVKNLQDLWAKVFTDSKNRTSYPTEKSPAPEFVLALLDDKARPVITAPQGEIARDWKRPFVATEIGEALPHWEATLYLQRPEQIRETAQRHGHTLSWLIASALGAIACGGWLVVNEARRQMALATQKADFVSNVSHELKTPLTSIRMFAELMHNERGSTLAKHPQYLRIIMVEAERLTRLINNVLDFASLERKQKHLEKKPIDFHSVVARVWESQELHLEENGFTTHWDAAPPPYPVLGDPDALAQILVNLISNAEKYSGENKQLEIRSRLQNDHLEFSVLDRGLGIPKDQARKIFDPFYRAHDSLSSGIQGSGLGLTLAQRLAKEHGGKITYQPRPDGGSQFTLLLPLAPTPSAKP